MAGSVLALAETPGHLIRRAQQVHTALWAERLRGELTGPQYAALVTLALEPGIDQGGLAQRASLDKNTAAGVVRRLAQHGWVARQGDPADARRKRLRLTTSARSALRAVTPAAALVQQDLLAPVAPQARARLVELLGSVARVEELTSAVRRNESDDGLPVLDMTITPGYLIRRAQQIHGHLWNELVGPELTAPQYAVLSAVAAHPGSEQGVVGQLASLDKSSTADIVTRLERNGWLRRAPSNRGGRRITVELSRGASSRLSRVTPSVGRVQERLLGPLAIAESRLFVEGLAVVAYREPRSGT